MLDRELAEEVLRAARRRGGSFAELFVEERSSTSIRLDDGKVEELTTGLDRGAGVRVAQGTSLRLRLLQPARSRRACWRLPRPRAPRCATGDGGAVVDLTRAPTVPARTASSVRPATCRPPTRSRGCASVDDAARAYSPEVVQVVGVYGDSLQRRLIATSDGRWVEEDRPRIRLVAQVVAKRDDNIQTGFHGPAACSGRRVPGSRTRRAPPPRSRPAAPSRCWTASPPRRAR